MLKQFFEHMDHTTALVDANGSITYGELCQSVLNLADVLMLVHQKYSGAFAIELPDSIAWMIADLAALAAGVPVVPIPSFFSPTQRLHAFQTAGVTVSIAAGDVKREDDLPLQIGIDRAHLAITGFSPVSLPATTAKITFTSGTTGNPKGVCLSAETMFEKALQLKEALRDVKIERHRCMLPLAVLLENVGGVYVSLLSGATATLGAPAYTPQMLAQALIKSEANSCILVPELLKALVASGERFPNLRYAAVGGAHVSPSLIDTARKQGIPAYEGYGLSEACSVVALNTPSRDKIGSCGSCLKPEDVTIASDGEIWIRNPGFLGYVGEPAPNERFATGDIGDLDAQGFLQIKGRKKNIIVTSYGRNLSPEWVESALTSQPGIKQAMLIGDGMPFNCAVLVTSGPMLASNAVRNVNQELPDYARVSAYVLAKEPFSTVNGEMTPTGKLDRATIAAHYLQDINCIYERLEA